MPSYWIAELLASEAVRDKIARKHGITFEEVRSRIVGISGLRISRVPDPRSEYKLYVEFGFQRSEWQAVVFPVDDPIGDVYALLTAYRV